MNIDEASERIVALETNIANFEKKLNEKFEDINKNMHFEHENRVLNHFFKFITALAAVIAVSGFVAYKINSDNIAEFKNNLQSQVDKWTGGLAAETAVVYSASKDENLRGYVSFVPDSGAYKVFFTIPALVTTEGAGSSQLNGFKIVPDDSFRRKISVKSNGEFDPIFYDLLNDAIYINLDKPIAISKGYSADYRPAYYVYIDSCETIRKLLKDLPGKKFDIFVTPSFDKIKNAPQPKLFHVSFEYDPYLKCTT